MIFPTFFLLLLKWYFPRGVLRHKAADWKAAYTISNYLIAYENGTDWRKKNKDWYKCIYEI